MDSENKVGIVGCLLIIFSFITMLVSAGDLTAFGNLTFLSGMLGIIFGCYFVFYSIVGMI